MLDPGMDEIRTPSLRVHNQEEIAFVVTGAPQLHC